MPEILLPPRLSELLNLELGEDASGFLISTIKEVANRKIAEYSNESRSLSQKYESNLASIRRQVSNGVGTAWEEHEKVFDLHYWEILQSKITRWREILELCGK